MGVFDMYHDQHEQLPIVCTKDNCQGKIFIVTGSNTGMGFEAAKHLVSCRPTRVILAVRSLDKGEEARRRIEADTGVVGVAEVWKLDMASYESIKAFAKKASTLDRLDAMIENAGRAAPTFTMSEGLETSVTINVTGTFLLASLLLPKLRNNAMQIGSKTRLTIVGSGAAFFIAGFLEKIDNDANILAHLSNEANGYDGSKQYPATKLIQLYLLRELAARNPSSDGVILSLINPGLCRTELGRDAPLSFKIQLRILWAIMGRTAEEGGRTLLHGGFAGEECHGKYLSECRAREEQVPDWVTNESGQKIQQRLWNELSDILNRVSPGCL